jgi:hypothetical protein
MHTSKELRRDSFAIEIDGESASIDDVLKGFGSHDRLGLVVRDPCGAVGASNLLLAAVTAFYDRQRARGEEFFIYPDYFLFHVDRPLGDHSMLDVFPSHKEVVVPDDPEAIVEAVNDRAITWLLVPEGESAEAQLAPEARASAHSRIVGAFAYSPTGRVAHGDVRIAGNDITEAYVRAVLDPEGLVATIGDPADPYAATVARRAAEVAPGMRAQLLASRERLREKGRPVESYRRLTLDQALASLAPGRATGAPASHRSRRMDSVAQIR